MGVSTWEYHMGVSTWEYPHGIDFYTAEYKRVYYNRLDCKVTRYDLLKISFNNQNLIFSFQ